MAYHCSNAMRRTGAANLELLVSQENDTCEAATFADLVGAAAAPAATITTDIVQKPAVMSDDSDVEDTSPTQTANLAVVSRVFGEMTAVAAGIAELTRRYEGVVYDVSTTAGMELAKAGRRELRTTRTGVQKAARRAKSVLAAMSKTIGSRAEEIIEPIAALEDPIDDVIMAEENRKAAEASARKKAEADRIEALTLKITGIRSMAMVRHGTPSVDVEVLINSLELFSPSDDEFGDLVPAAKRAKDETLQVLSEILAVAKQHEAAHAAAAASAAEMRRQQDALAAERSAFAAERAAAAAESARSLKISVRIAEIAGMPTTLANASVSKIQEAMMDLDMEDPADFGDRIGEASAVVERTTTALQVLMHGASIREQDAARLAAEEAARQKAIADEAARLQAERDREEAAHRAKMAEERRAAAEVAEKEAAALSRVQAAGPELLAALVAVLAEYRTMAAESGVDLEHCAAVIVAEVAILRAKGE